MNISETMPKTRAEWRAASSALRRHARAERDARRGGTATIGALPNCGRRYLFAWAHGRGAECYNGEAPRSVLLYMRAAMKRRASGDRSRTTDVESWLRASRALPAYPLP